jgi:hypothetical protein
MHDRPEDEQRKSKKNRKSNKSSYPRRDRRFDFDDIKGKPPTKGKGKTRVTWRSRKVELEQMDIEDLRDYVLETEY